MKKVLIYVPVVLILGTLEWVHTLYELAQVRAALGQIWREAVKHE